MKHLIIGSLLLASLTSFCQYSDTTSNESLFEDDVIDLPSTCFRASLLYPMVRTFEFSVERFLPNKKSINVSPSVSYRDDFNSYYYYSNVYEDSREFVSAGIDVGLRTYKGSLINGYTTKANIYFEYLVGVDWSLYSGSYTTEEIDYSIYPYTYTYKTFEINEEVLDFRGSLAIGANFVYKRFLSIDANIGLGFRYSEYEMDSELQDDLDVGEYITSIGYRGVVPKFTIAIGAANYAKN